MGGGVRPSGMPLSYTRNLVPQLCGGLHKSVLHLKLAVWGNSKLNQQRRIPHIWGDAGRDARGAVILTTLDPICRGIPFASFPIESTRFTGTLLSSCFLTALAGHVRPFPNYKSVHIVWGWGGGCMTGTPGKFVAPQLNIARPSY